MTTLATDWPRVATDEACGAERGVKRRRPDSIDASVDAQRPRPSLPSPDADLPAAEQADEELEERAALEAELAAYAERAAAYEQERVDDERRIAKKLLRLEKLAKTCDLLEANIEAHNRISGHLQLIHVRLDLASATADFSASRCTFGAARACVTARAVGR